MRCKSLLLKSLITLLKDFWKNFSEMLRVCNLTLNDSNVVERLKVSGPVLISQTFPPLKFLRCHWLFSNDQKLAKISKLPSSQESPGKLASLTGSRAKDQNRLSATFYHQEFLSFVFLLAVPEPELETPFYATSSILGTIVDIFRFSIDSFVSLWFFLSRQKTFSNFRHCSSTRRLASSVFDHLLSYCSFQRVSNFIYSQGRLESLNFPSFSSTSRPSIHLLFLLSSPYAQSRALILTTQPITHFQTRFRTQLFSALLILTT